MIKICVILNEGQGQYNEHMMHSRVWGSHCANIDDDDFNSFREIACEGQTHRHGLVYVNFFRHNEVWVAAYGVMAVIKWRGGGGGGGGGGGLRGCTCIN